jgi:hypothetical protein
MTMGFQTERLKAYRRELTMADREVDMGPLCQNRLTNARVRSTPKFRLIRPPMPICVILPMITIVLVSCELYKAGS